MAHKATVIKKVEFEAAHFLPKYSYMGKCNSIHGHSYKMFISIKEDINQTTGIVIDFKTIKEAVKPCLDKLDHCLLNDYIEIPTAENIILWVWKQLSENGLRGISSIELWETENCRCIINKDDLDKDVLREWETSWRDGHIIYKS
jgi:6-pyruvoyltetrahydropterin/6-carboxytetrahydropterin synthase